MQQNKVLFFGIIMLALVVVAGMILLFFFLPEPLSELVPLQQQVDINVVVAPGIKPWVDEAAKKFNQENREVQVTPVSANEMVPAGQFQTRPNSVPPAAWLAEASFVVDMAAGDGYQFTDAQPVAGSSLAWGGYNDKIEQFNQVYGDLNWENAHAKATGRDGFKLVMASPQNTAEGLAVLIAATAAHLGTDTLTAGNVGSADAWLTETLGNNNAQPRSRPAETLASVQGRSIGDAGLLSVASWRSVNLNQSDAFSVLPAEPAVVLDYPFVIWAGNQSTPEARQAAQQFAQFLLEAEQQNALAAHGFDPAGAGQSAIQVDGQAARRLLSWAGRVLQ